MNMTAEEIKALESKLAQRVGELGNAVVLASDGNTSDPGAYEAARRAISDVSAMVARLDFARRRAAGA
jgi:hypothetical protein